MSEPSSDLTNLSSQEKRALLAQLLHEKAQRETRSYPLSAGQQALWFLHQSLPASAAYHVGFTTRIRSQVVLPAIRQVFQTLIARHPALRTTFAARENGELAQTVHGYQELSFQPLDASGWTWDDLNNRMTAAYRQPFDLQQGPLMRVHLFTRATEDHVLLLTIHHIVIDGWSLAILLDEFRILYAAELAGRPGTLPPLPLAYADYVRKQADMLAGPGGAELWDYWRRQLAGELPVLNLPTDRPRPPVQTDHGASLPFKLTAQLTRQLKELAQAEGATLYMLLLAAFQVLLARYTSQEDIIVGSPANGRDQPDLAGIVGYFVNMLVLRADLSGNPPFSTFLSQVRRTVLEALAHAEYPFPLLVERLQPDRDPSRTPLFQVAFGLKRSEQSRELVELLTPDEPGLCVNWGGLSLEAFDLPQEEGQFDLVVDLAESQTIVSGVIKYNTDLFQAATMTRLSGHFKMLLEGIAANPNQCLAALPILTGTEQQQLLIAWNATQMEYPQNTCVQKLFEAQAAQTPDAVAVIYGDEQLTYQELNHRANQLAHYLRTLGVGPDVPVGICLERSLALIIALLGTLKAGGAYLPLDLTYPAERLTFMLQDAQVPVLLTQENLRATAQHWNLPDCRIVCLDSDWRLMTERRENLGVCVSPNHLAYAIYTSGSTGKPKGVLIPHQGLLNLVCWHQREFEITAAARATQLAGLAFDASVWEVWPYLTRGARLYLVEPNILDSPQQLQAWLIAKEISISFIPTPLAEELLALPWPSAIALRIMLTGGDKLHKYPAANLPFKLVNNYGPTENTVVSTSGVVAPNAREKTSAPTIGRPIANTQVYILDRALQPAPIGVPGELHVGGDSLARGYLNRPDLTAEKFISNPFALNPSLTPSPIRGGMGRGGADARLYKTGDLARYLPDGQIEFLGRIDQQVKIRGFRIELGEIEAVLNACPGVKEAVVMVREDHPGEKRLVAYLTPAAVAQAATITDLRGFLKTQLPEYMLPAAFVILPAFPLTPNGKVAQRALPAPELSGSIAEKYVAPRTPTEKMLAEIWVEVLKLPQVGIQDDFFELGGHSLLATQVILRIRRSFSIDLPLSAIFERPTIAELAQLIAARQAAQFDRTLLQELLEEINELSDDEAHQQLLAEERKEHNE